MQTALDHLQATSYSVQGSKPCASVADYLSQYSLHGSHHLDLQALKVSQGLAPQCAATHEVGDLPLELCLLLHAQVMYWLEPLITTGFLKK